MLDGTFTLEQEVVVDDEVADMIEFVNPYSAKETGLTLFAQKEMNGRDLVEKEFVFELYEANAEFVVNGAAIQAKENAIDGKVVFDELTFAEVGTYYYVITEKAGTASGVTYDDTKYFVTITVTDDLAGNLDHIAGYAATDYQAVANIAMDRAS
jgi:pilin isopeptide linkage protein